MSGIVWSKFFWSDWESDPRLKLCSLASQGLWMRLLCLCAQSDPPGRAAIDGRPLTDTQIAAVIGRPKPEVCRLLAELESNGVFSRGEDGCVISRRMERDAKARAEAQENGRKGGNPTLRRKDDDPDNGGVNPPPKGRDKPHKPRARSQRTEEPTKRVPPVLGATAPRDETRAIAAWDGPDDIGKALGRAMSPEALASYLAPASWDESSRTIMAATGQAYAVLADALRDPRVLASALDLEPFNLVRPRPREHAA